MNVIIESALSPLLGGFKQEGWIEAELACFFLKKKLSPLQGCKSACEIHK